MSGETSLTDTLFQEAVAAIDAGAGATLNRLLAEHPDLVRQRLQNPGPWAGDPASLQDFFRQPYLLWFVAEDPVRNGKLPANIATLARMIVATAQRIDVPTIQEQVDYALRLVCWSWIARECGVQVGLINVMLDAGADIDGSTLNEGRFGTNCDAAIYNKNYAAAEHLLARGARLTLTAAVCLNRWADAERLFRDASRDDQHNAFVQAALNGQAEALRRMLGWGVPPTIRSSRNQSHGTALHHAVWSGQLPAVQVLVEAGADLQQRDTIYSGTPLDWAKYAEGTTDDSAKQTAYQTIADYLRQKGGL